MKNTSELSIILALVFAVFPLCAQKAADRNSSGPSTSTDAPTKAIKTPDVIFVPTPQPAVDKMLELAEVKPGNIVYDLGCGDGRIVVTAAKKYGAKATGFDVDPQRIKESRENVASNHVENLVTIKEQDIFTVDLSKADVVTLYLLPSLNVKLIPQLEKLKPGARIVSYSFNMEGVEPAQVFQDGRYTIYKWVAPLKKQSRTAKATSSAY